MSESIPRIYSDANPIIELAKLAKGLSSPEREYDMFIFGQMLKAAGNREIELYTSSISVAECVTANGIYDKEVQEFYIGVLTSGRMFRLVQDSIFVAEQARNLRWEHHIALGGADAIHVASAIESGCAEFISWDAGISTDKKAAKVSAMKEMGIRVILPSQSVLLPNFYWSQAVSLIDPPENTRLQ